MSDNLTKARITKLENQIKAAGLPVPVLQDDLSFQEKEAVLKEFWNSNKTSGDSAIAELRRQADLRGILYDDDATEEVLKTSIKEVDDALKASGEKNMAIRKASMEMSPDILEVAKVMAQEVGAAVAKEVNHANKKDGEERVVTEREYDPSDLTEAMTFFAPMIYWKLPAKRVGGQIVKPPFGKIEFKLLEGSSVRVGDQNQTRYLCAYTTDSKREQAYLLTHPRYNKTFYSSDVKARITSDEHKYAIKFGERHNVLKTYQAPALYALAADLQLPVDVGMSLDAIRDLIAGEQAKMDIIVEKNHRQELIRASERESLLRKATE